MDGIRIEFITISNNLNVIVLRDCSVEFFDTEVEIHGIDVREAQIDILIDVHSKRLFINTTSNCLGKIDGHAYEYAIKTWSIGGI